MLEKITIFSCLIMCVVLAVFTNITHHQLQLTEQVVKDQQYVIDSLCNAVPTSNVQNTDTLYIKYEMVLPKEQIIKTKKK